MRTFFRLTMLALAAFVLATCGKDGELTRRGGRRHYVPRPPPFFYAPEFPARGAEHKKTLAGTPATTAGNKRTGLVMRRIGETAPEE